MIHGTATDLSKIISMGKKLTWTAPCIPLKGDMDTWCMEKRFLGKKGPEKKVPRKKGPRKKGHIGFWKMAKGPYFLFFCL